MALTKVKLTRDLRRSILRGHPWIYRDAVKILKKDQLLTEVVDQKGKFLAWAFFDEAGPLSLRVLSLEKKPPNAAFFRAAIQQSGQRRSFLDVEKTNAYRLINGEGDRLPGLVCDLYDKTAVLQFDGEGAKKFWSQYPIGDWIQEFTGVKGVVDKTRGGYEFIQGTQPSELTEIRENGLRFVIDIVRGQKTGFFLDQRDNRFYVRSLSKNKSVMNLFSYTGGFSVSAGAGGATEVLSVDLSAPALEMAKKSWELNGFQGAGHETLAVDVFDHLASHDRLWDIVIADPPSMAHSEKQRAAALSKYTAIFKEAALKVKKGGSLIVSSCSSHVSFEDFFQIITESLSQAKKRGLILRVSGQGADHPFPHICPELRYLKFVHLELE